MEHMMITPATLDRRNLLVKLIPNPQDYLVITGLAGPARDAAALCEDGPNLLTMAGCMGAATCLGLGVAMSAPDKNIIVITGDGELLMNIGSLATVATVAPQNLSIICIDNGCHGETGGQTGHTSHKTNLQMIAAGAGIASTTTIETESDLVDGAKFLMDAPGPRFIQLRVKDGPPSSYKRNMDLAECRLRFRAALIN